MLITHVSFGPNGSNDSSIKGIRANFVFYVHICEIVSFLFKTKLHFSGAKIRINTSAMIILVGFQLDAKVHKL